VRFSRTHIPARRKTFGFALLGGQERRQFFTLCDIRKIEFQDYFAQTGSTHRYIHVAGVLFERYIFKILDLRIIYGACLRHERVLLNWFPSTFGAIDKFPVFLLKLPHERHFFENTAKITAEF
jgi:hypothetical protein